MKSRKSWKAITAQNGKLVYTTVTNSGVVGYVASGIPPSVIHGLYQKLLQRQELLNRSEKLGVSE